MDTRSNKPLHDAAPRPDGYSFSPLLPATDRGARNLVALIAALLFAACLSATFNVSTKLAECRQETPAAKRAAVARAARPYTYSAPSDGIWNKVPNAMLP